MGLLAECTITMYIDYHVWKGAWGSGKYIGGIINYYPKQCWWYCLLTLQKVTDQISRTLSPCIGFVNYNQHLALLYYAEIAYIRLSHFRDIDAV